MVSSIELLKLAYEGALTLKRSPGSLVLQNCCADNLAVDGVSLVLTTKSTISLNVCTAVLMWRSRVLQQGRLQNEHFAGAKKEKATHRKRKRYTEREGDEQNALSQVLNYLVGLQQCKTLLLLKTNFSSFRCSLRAADEIGLSAIVGLVRRFRLHALP
ncbi:hypothetical protein Efla_007313 [Eimeria flavescens]